MEKPPINKELTDIADAFMLMAEKEAIEGIIFENQGKLNIMRGDPRYGRDEISGVERHINGQIHMVMRAMRADEEFDAERQSLEYPG